MVVLKFYRRLPPYSIKGVFGRSCLDFLMADSSLLLFPLIVFIHQSLIIPILLRLTEKNPFSQLLKTPNPRFLTSLWARLCCSSSHHILLFCVQRNPATTTSALPPPPTNLLLPPHQHFHLQQKLPLPPLQRIYLP